MTNRFLILIAALGLLAACETAPKDAGDAAGSSASSSASSTASSSSSSSIRFICRNDSS